MKLRRLTLLLLSTAGVATVIAGLFAEDTALLVTGLILSPLGLIGAILTRDKCSSCNALLGTDEKELCASCERTLVDHLPRLAPQIKTR